MVNLSTCASTSHHQSFSIPEETLFDNLQTLLLLAFSHQTSPRSLSHLASTKKVPPPRHRHRYLSYTKITPSNPFNLHQTGAPRTVTITHRLEYPKRQFSVSFNSNRAAVRHFALQPLRVRELWLTDGFSSSTRVLDCKIHAHLYLSLLGRVQSLRR